MTPQERLHALLERTWDELALLAALVAAGEITPAEFGDRMAAALETAHTEAVVIGREHGGDTAPAERDDRAYAEGVVDGEAEFLALFVLDLQGDRYRDAEGRWDTAAIERRAQMYGNRLVGTANEVWTQTLPGTTLYTWHLGAAEQSCGDCPRIAAGSPYLYEDMPTMPGAGETECLTFCKCYVTTDGGDTSFTLPD
jgi:hypothetical protein